MPKHSSSVPKPGHDDAFREGAKLHERKMQLKKQAQVGQRLASDQWEDDRSKAYGSYPADYYDTIPSKSDETLLAKARLKAQAGPQAMFTVTDADVQQQLKMDRIAEAMDLDNTFIGLFGNEEQYGLMHPAELKELRKMYPEYFARREKKVEEWGQLQKRLAKIKLRGWKTRDDFILWMMYKSGQIQVPHEAIYAFQDRVADNAEQFARGKWNPFNEIFKPDAANAVGSVDLNQPLNVAYHPNRANRFGASYLGANRAQGLGKWSQGNAAGAVAEI
jgi:hypothetical protein